MNIVLIHVIKLSFLVPVVKQSYFPFHKPGGFRTDTNLMILLPSTGPNNAENIISQSALKILY